MYTDVTKGSVSPGLGAPFKVSYRFFLFLSNESALCKMINGFVLFEMKFHTCAVHNQGHTVILYLLNIINVYVCVVLYSFIFVYVFHINSELNTMDSGLRLYAQYALLIASILRLSTQA